MARTPCVEQWGRAGDEGAEGRELTPDEWTPSVSTIKESEKPHEKRGKRRREWAAYPLTAAKRHSEGREHEAKEIKGAGQWASMGELLM